VTRIGELAHEAVAECARERAGAGDWLRFCRFKLVLATVTRVINAERFFVVY